MTAVVGAESLTKRFGEVPAVGLAPSVGRFMPTRASDALMGLRVDHLVSPGAGAFTLIAWAGALGFSVSPGPFGRTSTDCEGLACGLLRARGLVAILRAVGHISIMALSCGFGLERAKGIEPS